MKESTIKKDILDYLELAFRRKGYFRGEARISTKKTVQGGHREEKWKAVKNRFSGSCSRS